jgi:uncharacterized protein (DUF1501 family)
MRNAVSRRQFLQMAGYGIAGLAASRIAFKPSVLLAQSAGPGTGKVMVCINFYGGMDGLAAMPFYQGPLLSVINNQLRPTIGINPASVIQLGGQAGIANKLGFHPAFQPLANVAANHLKIIQGYGIPGEDSRSHDTCQIKMSLGVTELQSGDNVGFLARIMDYLNWESLQYWAFTSENGSDTNSKKLPPTVVYDTSSFGPYGTYNEGSNDIQLAEEIARTLVEVRTPTTPLGAAQQNSLQTLQQTVAVVRNEINVQTVGNNAAGDYVGYGIGSNLRDAAKILKAKATSSTFNYQNKDMIILVGQGGYDTHSNQNDPQSGGIGANLDDLAGNLAVFYKDIESFGILNNTVVVGYSEFGRTAHENGTPGSLSVGTDHGLANNTFVFGGGVSAGVIGDPPSVAELNDSDTDAIITKIDFRDIFSDILSWMSINPKSVFDDAAYTPHHLGIFD